MIDKLLPTGAVLIFGMLMFAAGAFAPDALRTPLLSLASPSVAGKSHATAAKVVAPAAPSAGQETPSPPAPAPVLAETLLVTTPAPAKASYALMAGQFPTAAAAAELSRRIKTLRLPAVPAIHAVDRAGNASVIVAVGPYPSIAEARQAQAGVTGELDLVGAPLVIVLPPPAPAG